MEHAIVINADLGPLHGVSPRPAIRTLRRQVAVVYEAEPDLRMGIRPLRLVQHVVTKWLGPGLVPAGCTGP